jgi:hypothetical protein
LQAGIVAAITLVSILLMYWLLTSARWSDHVAITAAGIRSIEPHHGTTKLAAWGTGLHVGESAGSVDVVMPYPASHCGQLATELSPYASCDANSLTVYSSVDLTWDSTELITMDDYVADWAILNTISDGFNSGVRFTGPKPPRLHLTNALDNAKLVLGRSATTIRIPLSLSQGQSGNTDLLVHITSRTASEARTTTALGPSGFVIDGLSNLLTIVIASDFTLEANDLTITADAGTHNGAASGPADINSSAPLRVVATGPPPNLVIQQGVLAFTANSVSAAGFDFVPNLWDRNSLLISIVLASIPSGLVGLIVWILLRR